MLALLVQQRAPQVRRHVPYRNSLLTNILRDSLGGNCRTVFVATINPDPAFLGESLSTCRFIQRCGLLTVRVQRNRDTDYKVLAQTLAQQRHALAVEVTRLRRLLIAGGAPKDMVMTPVLPAAAAALAAEYESIRNLQQSGIEPANSAMSHTGGSAEIIAQAAPVAPLVSPAVAPALPTPPQQTVLPSPHSESAASIVLSPEVQSKALSESGSPPAAPAIGIAGPAPIQCTSPSHSSASINSPGERDFGAEPLFWKYNASGRRHLRLLELSANRRHLLWRDPGTREMRGGMELRAVESVEPGVAVGAVVPHTVAAASCISFITADRPLVVQLPEDDEDLSGLETTRNACVEAFRRMVDIARAEDDAPSE